MVIEIGLMSGLLTTMHTRRVPLKKMNIIF